MKATEQYFSVVLFIMLYKVVLTFESVDEILKCDHSNESYWALLSCGTVHYAVQGGSSFWVCGWNPNHVWISYKILWKCHYSWHFNWEVLRSTLQDGTKTTEQYFPVVLLFMLYKVVITWVCENPLSRWVSSKRNTQFRLDRRIRGKTATLDDPDKYMKTSGLQKIPRFSNTLI